MGRGAVEGTPLAVVAMRGGNMCGKRGSWFC